MNVHTARHNDESALSYWSMAGDNCKWHNVHDIGLVACPPILSSKWVSFTFLHQTLRKSSPESADASAVCRSRSLPTKYILHFVGPDLYWIQRNSSQRRPGPPRHWIQQNSVSRVVWAGWWTRLLPTSKEFEFGMNYGQASALHKRWALSKLPAKCSILSQIAEPPFTQPNTTTDVPNVDPNGNATVSEAPRPSEGWLRNPAWIGMPVPPPHEYFLILFRWWGEPSALLLYPWRDWRNLSCCRSGTAASLCWWGWGHSWLSWGHRQFAHTNWRSTQYKVPCSCLHNYYWLSSLLALPLLTQYDVFSSRVSPTSIPVLNNNHYCRDAEVLQLGGINNELQAVSDGSWWCSNHKWRPAHYMSDIPVPVGHLVNVTHVFTTTEAAAGSRNTKVVAKKKQTSVLGHIILEGITRVKFIEACLAIHSLDTIFALGVNSGPPIRVWWTASAWVVKLSCQSCTLISTNYGSSGKAGAPTFMTDNTFNIALEAILKKKKSKVQISVEFDSDNMAGFCIAQHVRYSFTL